MFARAAASVVIAGALVLGLSGCNFFAPQTTTMEYDPSDGVSVDVGNIRVLNALAIASEDAETLNFLATIVNQGEKGVTVNLQFEIDGERHTESRFIAGGESENLGYGGDDAEQLLLVGTGVGAGELLPVYVQYGNETGQTLMAPVLDSSLPEYEEFVPTAPSPTAE